MYIIIINHIFLYKKVNFFRFLLNINFQPLFNTLKINLLQ